MPRFKHEAMCQHYTFTQNLFTTHTYLTFAFSLINTDGRNAAVDPRWGRVIHQTLPSFPSLAPPIQEESGNQTNNYHHSTKLYRKISRVCCRLYCYGCAARVTMPTATRNIFSGIACRTVEFSYIYIYILYIYICRTSFRKWKLTLLTRNVAHANSSAGGILKRTLGQLYYRAVASTWKLVRT